MQINSKTNRSSKWKFICTDWTVNIEIENLCIHLSVEKYHLKSEFLRKPDIDDGDTSPILLIFLYVIGTSKDSTP